MTKQRIQELADFFYSSNSSHDIPLRICCVTGQFAGFSLTKEGFIALFSILSKSRDLKKDLENFLNTINAETD